MSTVPASDNRCDATALQFWGEPISAKINKKRPSLMMNEENQTLFCPL